MAERSSAGRPKASLNSWSTRAFMSRSLLLALLAGQQLCKRAASNSFVGPHWKHFPVETRSYSAS